MQASRISSLSSGEFVGMVADDPSQKIKLKMFHSEIMNESEKLNTELRGFRSIPTVAEISNDQVIDNFNQVKLDIKTVIMSEVDKLKMLKT